VGYLEGEARLHLLPQHLDLGDQGVDHGDQ
jgi:hypothetical protein